ncbi:unnamed protein product, partial [Soboliphyme baturini]|uniref:FA domain-containing protein n=1 Tax=Soboliphyme baturini TaxID=241478 RepID=A0A183JB11_9BILA
MRLGSRFRYTGKTEWGVTKDGNLCHRENNFERRPSQRYGPRQSHATREKQKRQERVEKQPQSESAAVHSSIPPTSTPPLPPAAAKTTENPLL